MERTRLEGEVPAVEVQEKPIRRRNWGPSSGGSTRRCLKQVDTFRSRWVGFAPTGNNTPFTAH